MSDPHIHFETLPNGLTLLLREARAIPVASLQIFTRVGSADERADEAGLAHFHEHMLFKGTERRGVGEIAGEVEGLGGQINAYTSFDTTVYYATLPSDSLSAGLDVLVDAVRNSTFDPEEITREIGVVLEEIHRANDSPYSVLSDAVFAECYHAHPYRAPILGSEESVSSITRERLRSFFERWYAPDRFVVVAAGDFDAKELAKEIKAAFADAAPSRTPTLRPVEPVQQAMRTVLLERSFERSALDLSWCTTSLAHPDTPYLDLLGFVLGEGDSSRLVRRVKERDALADRIDASSYTPLEPGLFSVTADVEDERIPECLEAIAREIEQLRQAAPRSDELEKARANFLASEHFERESVSGMAGKLGSFHVLGGDFRLEQTYMEAIRTATPEDLQRVAQQYLGSERLTAGVLRNEDADASLTGKDVRDAFERGAQRSGESVAVRALPAPAEPSRPTGVRPARTSAGLASYELGGGVHLHVVPRHDVPVVGLRAALRGGLLSETRENSGITQFTTDLWMRGTRHRSAADLVRAIENLASDIDGFAGRNSLGLSLDVTSDRLEPALDLFAEVLLTPAFDPEEIERQRRDTLASLERREDRLGVRVFDLLQAALYREHPYGLPVIGTTASVSGLDRTALVEHHARLVRASNLVIAVAGDVDPDAMAEQLTALLSELSHASDGIPEPAVEPGPTEVREVEVRKAREQAHLALGFHGLTVDDPDRFPLEVLAQLLAGQGGRLFLELRDRQSLAYSVSAMNVEGLAPGFFATYIATSPERLDEAREGMFDELRRTLDAPPEENALERSRRYLIGGHLIDGQRSGSRALHTALDSLYGLGPDHDDGYAERIRSVTAEDVLRVARRVVDLDRAVIATIRP